MSDYRRRLYDAYVSSHLRTFRTISAHELERNRRVLQRQFGRFLPLRKDATILDLGCGYGGFLYFLQRQGYTNTIGIDLSQEQIDMAQALGVTDVQVAEGRNFLRQHAGAFDVIVALDLLEHLSKDEVLQMLDGMFAALRPAGQILVRVPNGDSPFASWIRYGDFTHEVIFTPTSIRQVLHVTGFTDVQVHPVEPVVHGIASAGRWLLWNGIKQLFRLYLLVEQGTAGSGVFTSNLAAVARKPGDAESKPKRASLAR